MATVINDGESIRLTEAGVVMTLEKGGEISVESNGNDITFYRNGKRIATYPYTAFTTPTFTSAEDGRSQIEAMLSASTGASNPGKAEDSVHVSGDVGDFVLAVRVDPNAAGNPAAALAVAGDYIPIIVDNLGRLYVAPHALLAGEAHVGQVGGESANPSANFTRPSNTPAYASGDLIANSITAGSVVAMSFTAARVAAGSFVIRRARLHKDNQAITSATFRLHLFSANPVATAPTAGDNEVLELNSLAAGAYLGYFDFNMASSPDIQASDIELDAGPANGSDITVELASGTTIWGLLEARAAYTPASAEVFTVTLEILQD